MKIKKCNINSLKGIVIDFGFYISQFIIVLFVFTSCSNTKFLADDEKLYTYTVFSEKGLGKINNKPIKAYELYKVGIVKTNRPIVFMPRLNLSIYNYWKPSGDWGPRHYLHRVFGKPPVLLKNVKPKFRVKVMKQRLYDMGLFDSDITLDLKVYGKNDKKIRAKYSVLFKPAYTIRNLNFINKHSKLDSIINSSLDNSLIINGNDYWIKDLKAERNRLSKIIKNQGYYYFNPNDLLFYADTTMGNKQVDMSLIIKDDISKEAYNKYYIRNIDITINSNKPSLKNVAFTDSLFINQCYYKTIENTYRPKIITQAISIKPKEHYKYTKHENTLRYLQGMESFRSVEVSYSSVDDSLALLDAHIVLVPLKPLQTSLEVNFATKSNNFLGPAAIASIGHMNIFKGAEKLIFKLEGGFEWQKRASRTEYELGFNSYEIGGSLELIFPRFITPFPIKNKSTRYVPKTYFSMGLKTLKRVRYYDMKISQAKFGYSWRTSTKREYKIEPATIDYLHLTKTSIEFEEFLEQYPQVAKSFNEQFIIGSRFSYIYSTNPKKKKFNQFYYNADVDLSGNVINSVYNIFGLKDSGSPGSLFNVPYSQYAKLTNDLRYYMYFNEKTQLAFRLVAGVGIPYGNSTVLPYIKQYFAGGSQDIRAFYARTLGPGSYMPPESSMNNYYIDQSGEIKLMGNIEYRFPITYKTYGAFFVDAGNVWLINEDDTRPGGKFEMNKFVSDIAIGSGLGLRIDITYFVIRFDIGVPIRKPYIAGDGKWIFNNLSFFGDYIISFAVGYPF